jgi:alkylated DNA nucleotide flippase Atl1
MKNLLVSEGVEFDENDCVNMGKYFWEPKEK